MPPLLMIGVAATPAVRYSRPPIADDRAHGGAVDYLHATVDHHARRNTPVESLSAAAIDHGADVGPDNLNIFDFRRLRSCR